jgi:hypothetical protein
MFHVEHHAAELTAYSPTDAREHLLWKGAALLSGTRILSTHQRGCWVAPKYVIAISRCFGLFCEHLWVLLTIKWDASLR